MRRSLIVLSLLLPAFASAATILDGDFELGGGAWSTVPQVYIGPITAYGLCCANSGGAYTGGLKAAFFGGGNAAGGTVEQQFATTAGQSYQVGPAKFTPQRQFAS
jgi:hypothetical protein